MARTRSVVLVGVDGVVVDVEVDLSDGVISTSVVGLADKGVNEAKDRVRAALANSEERWPQKRVTIGLSPAWIPKAGAVIDLALALSMLAAEQRIPLASIADTVVMGELGLDGAVKHVTGVLPSVMTAARADVARVIVPAANVDEASLVPGIEVVGVVTLSHALAVLRGEATGAEPGGPVIGAGQVSEASGLDMADVIGQPLARRALEVAAAGGHHMFLHGPPGAGKTMLAERLPGLIPMLSLDEALEVTAVHSVAGTLSPHRPLVTTAPFENPHHTATVVSLVGGGSAGRPRPGAVSRAHRGVLFIDEAPEFPRAVLDSLREPLESGHVVVARSGFVARFPAQFQLVLAANPCPCGVGDARGVGCRCTPMQRIRYAGKLSGPLLDRLDLVVETHALDRTALLAEGARGESTEAIAARVSRAHANMQRRLAGSPWRTNARVPGNQLRGRGPLAVDASAVRWLREASSRGTLSARGIDKVLRVAWTLADLDDAPRPETGHVAEAVTLRTDSFRVAA